MIHHRTPEFSAELATMLDLLGPVFGTAQRVLPVHTTGRGAMEAAICNFFSGRDEIAVCCNGKFGEMWAALAASYGLTVHRVGTDWTRDIDPAEIDRTLAEHPAIRAVAVAHCDTSTGVRNDIAAIAGVARARGVLTLVDGVSSLGGMPFSFDEWDIDFAVTASQKCLMAAPGLAFVTVSERAWHAFRQSSLPRNYWNFEDILREVSRPRPETPGTPPVHVVLQVTEALRQIHEEGLELVYRRHERMAALVRQRLPALNLSLLCPDLRHRATTVTAIALSGVLPPKTLRDAVRRRGILTAAGLGTFADSAFRIGHMGDIREADVVRTLDAVAAVLEESGAGPPRPADVSRATA
jgi:aspartate aminotransferase-like enzyme